MNIRHYQDKDEAGWLRCRVLSFLDTAYFDNVLREKEHYSGDSIELIAEENGEIIGLIDVELDANPQDDGHGRSAMIWHVAVHPDHQRKGIGNLLLKTAEKLARGKGFSVLEAYTRDDEWVKDWYIQNGFDKSSSYYHVYFHDGEGMGSLLESQLDDLHPVNVFCHYTGKEIDSLRAKASRIHECICYRKAL